MRNSYYIKIMSTANLLMVIMAMHSNETPTLPYCMNGIRRQRNAPCVQVPSMKRNALNGNTIKQNKQSAIHKL